MSKIIVENRSSLSDSQCLVVVGEVIEKGRISNNGKQYCYATRFTGPTSCVVVTDLNKCSDRFVVIDDKPITPGGGITNDEPA